MVNKISVAIITLNEALNIQQCIQSVVSVADEIIVVDSGSTDDTTQLASSMGAKVIHHDFKGYIEQKNFAIGHCSYEYILSLDADEIADAKLIESIKLLKETGFKHDGYLVKRLNYIGNDPVKHGNWGNDKQMRLVKKSQASWEGKGVHERLMVKSTNIMTLDGMIHHYSYKNSSELFERTRRYASLAAAYLHKNGHHVSGATVYIKAISRFMKHYFLKAGFMDGKLGWLIGKQQYLEALWKYRGLRELNNK